MDRFLVFTVCLYIFFSPYYVFDSGLPQPADIIVSIGGLLFIITGKFKKVKKLPETRTLGYLFFVIFAVNLVNHLYLLNIGQEGKSHMAILYYAFNFIVFIMILYLVKVKQFASWVSLVTIISVAVQFAFAILGIGKNTASGREAIFFNNPNQLGYFALLSMSLFAVIPSMLRKNMLVFFFVTAATSYLVLISGSRASIISIVVLSAILYIKEGFKLNVRSIIFIFLSVFIFVTYIATNKKFLDHVEKAQTRNEQKASTFESEIQTRGYDRILIYPEYIFWGAGELANKRFKKSHHQLEIHSGFGTMLFSYGIVGIGLFFLLLYQIIRHKVVLNFLLLFPVLLYNFTHHGLRSTHFWIFLALVLAYSSFLIPQKITGKIKRPKLKFS